MARHNGATWRHLARRTKILRHMAHRPRRKRVTWRHMARRVGREVQDAPGGAIWRPRPAASCRRRRVYGGPTPAQCCGPHSLARSPPRPPSPCVWATGPFLEHCMVTCWCIADI